MHVKYSILRRRWFRFSAVLLMASMVVAPTRARAQQSVSSIAAPVDDHALVTLKGSVHPLARPANDRGAVASSLPMKRAILVLKRSDASEKSLKTLLSAMHDPKSPYFHQWLTPKQFGDRFGVSSKDIATTTAWLQSHGFQVNSVSNGRQSIEFSGTAGMVENAFHTSIHSYSVKGVQHYANSSEAKIPAALSPVVAGVLSLHNFEKHSNAKILSKAQIRPAANGKKASLAYDPKFTLGAGDHAVGPGDLWTIYNAVPLITASDNKIDGAGQKIAIVGRSDISLDDYTGFRQTLLPAAYASTVPFNQVQNGPDPGIVDGDDIEQTLDVEYSSALAPAAEIDLVVSGTTNTTDGVDLSAEYIVDNNLAPVMSTSYGLCEAEMGAGNQFYSGLWEQAAAQGITSMVAAGDNGSAGCDLVGPSGDDSLAYVADEGLQVSGTASTPYNVAVGGNQFSDDTTTYWSADNASTPSPLTSALSYVPEKVWNEACSPLDCGAADAQISAGSGGSSGCFVPVLSSDGNYITSCSGGYATPDWQAGVSGIPTTGMRHIPDVSLTAAGHDGYMVCYEGSCDSQSVYIVGGTSAASPAFAGVMSLVNEKTASRQGQANYTLYRLAGSEYGSVSSPNTDNLTSCNATNGNTVGSSCIFHDVTVGTNAVPCDGGTLNCSSTTAGTYGVLTAYDAAAGYDRATGLGSVNIANLVNHWNDQTLAATATTLSLGATQSTFGQPLSVTVAVNPATGSGTPTGDVALLTDSTVANAVGAGTLTLVNGAYTGTVSSLPGGTYHVSARYGGDTSYASSTSGPTAITVGAANSGVSLVITGTDPVSGTAIAGSTLPYGSQVAAVATLSGVTGQAVPVGTITFLSGGNTLATQTSDATGVATYNSSGYAIGSHTFNATYAGNNNYKPATSANTSFTVSKANTTSKVLSSSSFLVGANTATLSTIVTDDSFLSNPTGTVAFLVNGKKVGSSPVTAYTDPATGASEGIATFTLTAASLNAGANTITSSYAGDGNYVGSDTGSISVGYSTVAVANTIALAATPTSTTAGTPVSLTATVSTGGILATAGTVTFFDGSVAIGTAQVAGSAPATGHTTGTATLKLILAPGSHALKAVYAGILAAPTPVSSAVDTVTVTGENSSAVAVSAVANGTNPNNYDLTATVTGFGLAIPSSQVDFSETSVASDLGQSTVQSAATAHTFLSPTLLGDGDSGGASPGMSVVADFNGDGVPDIATTNWSTTAGSMSVLLGNGDGTFKTPVTYAAQLFATFINTGDFNGDGLVDIAITNQENSSYTNGTVSVYLSNGDGTFKPELITNQPGFGVGSVVGDFNRDGTLDLVTLQYYPMQLSVQFGNGDGTFQSAANYPIGNINDFSSYTLAIGDFNGDGAPDIVESNSSDANAGVFLNAGDGTLVLKEFLTTGTEPEWLSVSSLKQNGTQDIVVSNYADQTIGVFAGKGDGTFSDEVTYPVNGYAASVAIADFNGDGKLDLASSYFYPTASAGIMLGNGDGTFGKVTDYPLNQGHGYGLTAADLNNDGAVDLISSDINSGDTAADALGILLNVTQATATKQNVALAGATTATEEVIATYNGDTHYKQASAPGLFLKGSGVKATPQIVWTPASQWGAGSPLGSSVLNGVVKGNIAGTVSYTAQLGTGAPVSVTAASTLTALGTYTFTLTFNPVDTVSYSVATVTQTVQIVAADFSIEATPETLGITAGSSGTVAVSVPALYGFSGSATLSCGTPLPGGFSCTEAPATVAGGGTSTVTIQTSGLAAAQTAANAATTLRNWLGGGGIAMSLVLLLPIGRRGRRAFSLMAALLLVALMTPLQGCGGTGFSQDTVALVTSSATAASGSSITLTATVSSRHEKPGGTVTFFNGTSALGSAVALTGKVATLKIATLPVGLDALTAVYSGNKDEGAATSSVTSQLITGKTSVQIEASNGTTTHSTTVTVSLN